MDARRVGRLLISVAVAGCGGGGAAIPGPSDIPGLSTVIVSPPSVDLAVGQAVQVRVTAMDEAGSPISGGQLAFVSSAPTVATVSSDGTVTGVAAGSASITAQLTWRGTTRSGTSTITVAPKPGPGAPNEVTTPGITFQPARIVIAAGDSVTWVFSGATHNVTFLGAQPPGGNIPDQTAGAKVTRVFSAAGTFDYECTRHAGMTGQVVVQGAQPAVFTSVAVTPAAPAILVGGTVALTATPKDQNGSAMTGLPAPTFTTSASAIATVSSTGVVTGVAAGTATITATVTAGGVSHSGTAVVSVSAPAPGGSTVTTPSNTFAPATITIAAGGTVTWQFSGATHNVTFLTGQPTGGNIPDQAPGSAVSRTFPTPGTFDYECTRHAGMTGQVVVQGTQPAQYTSLVLTPATSSIMVDGTITLTATPKDQNGSAMTGLPAPTFTTSASAIATVSSTGVVTGVAAGTATITATVTAGSVSHSGTAVVSVSAPAPGGSTVTTPSNTFAPATITVAAGGTVTWQFSGATHNVTFLTGQPTGGNIPDQAPGSAVSRTFPTAGTFDYECTRHAGMTGQVVVQGTQPAQYTSLVLTPATSAILVGGTITLTATPKDQNGSAMTGLATATFTTSASAVATVSSSGVVTGVAAGTATITATLTVGAVSHSGTATIAVTAPQPGAATVSTPNNSFSPATVTIAVGGAVTWQFSGGTHNVTFNSAAPSGGNIPDQASGSSVSRTFSTAGTFSYQCTRHGGMNGSVVVQGTGGGGGGGGGAGFAAVRLTPSNLVLQAGTNATLTATGVDGAGQTVGGLPPATFASSNASVATVDQVGAVHAVATGTATITATITAAGVTHSATATVQIITGPVATITTTASTFAPNDLQVAVGTTVVWQFSGATHNVTFEDTPPAGGNIPDTAPGNAVARVFSAVGDYDYECTIHKGMKGRVRIK